MDLVVAHFGQYEDALDRELQARTVAGLLADSPRPAIFLGYIISRPHCACSWPSALTITGQSPAPYSILVEDGKMHDIEPSDLDRWCEFIFYRGLYRVAYARITRGSNPSITDTELQVAKFVVPEAPIDPSVAQYDRRVAEDLVSPQHRFWEGFKGEGTRGHWYNFEDRQPFYYAPPERPLTAEERDAIKRKLDDECQVQ